MDPTDPNHPDEQRRARARARILNPPPEALANSRKKWQIRELRRSVLNNFRFRLMIVGMMLLFITPLASALVTLDIKINAKDRASLAKTMNSYVDHYKGASRFPSPAQVVLYLQSQGQAAVVGTSQVTKSLKEGTLVVNGDAKTLNLYGFRGGLISVQATKDGPTLSHYEGYAGYQHYIIQTLKIVGPMALFLLGFIVVTSGLTFRRKKRAIIGAFPSAN